MSTRSTTWFITNTGACLVNMYRQYDGYPEGHGKELATFLAGIRRVGGRGPVGTANGIQCLAAQAVAHFKTEPGNIYLVPEEQAEEWGYEVRENPDGDWLIAVLNEDRMEYPFYGTPQEFLEMLEKGND